MTIKNNILDTLHTKNLKMIPRWQFIVYSILVVLGLVFIFLVTVFFFSLMLFVLSRYGYMYMPFFGFMATLKALSAIPLLLFGATIILLVLIEVISRKYTISFKRPLIVTLLSTTSFVVIVSFIISETSMHDYIHTYAKSRRIDIMSRAYDRPIPFKLKDDMTVVRGEVVATTSTSTSIRLFDGVILTAYASTSLMDRFIQPEIGKDIILLGTFLGDRIEILDIRAAPRATFGRHMGGGKHMHDGVRGSMSNDIGMPIIRVQTGVDK